MFRSSAPAAWVTHEPWWSCLCGRWTASCAYAIEATADDFCRVLSGCGSQLLKHHTVHRLEATK